jgi:hypothetical protein
MKKEKLNTGYETDFIAKMLKYSAMSDGCMIGWKEMDELDDLQYKIPRANRYLAGLYNDVYGRAFEAWTLMGQPREQEIA